MMTFPYDMAPYGRILTFVDIGVGADFIYTFRAGVAAPPSRAAEAP